MNEEKELTLEVTVIGLFFDRGCEEDHGVKRLLMNDLEARIDGGTMGSSRLCERDPSFELPEPTIFPPRDLQLNCRA
jgi:hypothetical protein